MLRGGQENERAPATGRSPDVTATKRRLLKLGRDAAKARIQLGADAVHDGDDGDRDAGGDQTVFNCRGAGFVTEEFY